jgi:hypothetical protein
MNNIYIYTYVHRSSIITSERHNSVPYNIYSNKSSITSGKGSPSEKSISPTPRYIYIYIHIYIYIYT